MAFGKKSLPLFQRSLPHAALVQVKNYSCPVYLVHDPKNRTFF